MANTLSTQANNSYLNDLNISSDNIYDWTLHLIDPKLKDEKWGAAIFEHYKPKLRSIWWYPYNKEVDVNLVRLFGRGQQPDARYRTMFDPKDKNPTYTSLNWDIVSVIPKFKKIITAEIEKIPINIRCEAVDEVSNSQRNMDRLRLQAQQPLNEKLQEATQSMGYQRPIKAGFDKQILKMPMNEVSGLDNMQFNLENDDELQLYMDSYYNQNCELANEICIEQIFKLNEIETLRKTWSDDAFDFGYVGARVYNSKHTGLPIIQQLEIPGILVPSSTRNDYKDAELWAYKFRASLNDIISYMGNTLTPQDVREMFEMAAIKYAYKNIYGDPYQWDLNAKLTRIDFDRIFVDAYYMEFKSQNAETYGVTTNRYGTQKMDKVDFAYKPEKPNQEKQQYWAEVVYKGYAIEGIENKVYDWGLLNNMIRIPGRPQLTEYSLRLWRFEYKSLVEQLIPCADNIQLAYLKAQHELRHALPKGFWFNVNVLSQINLGDGGVLTPTENIKQFKQTGSGIYNPIDENGNPTLANANAPHMPTEGGLTATYEEYWKTVEHEIEMMRQICGLNEATDASTPNPNSLIGVQKLSLLSSSNARWYLTDGFKKFFEDIARYVSLILQDIAQYDKGTWQKMKDMVGNYPTDVIESMGTIYLHQYNIFIEDSLSEQEEQDFKNLMMAAYQKGEIDLADVLNIWFMKNYKLQIKLFNLKRAKQIAINQQMQQQGIAIQQKTDQDMRQLKLAIAQIQAQADTQKAEIAGKYLLLDENMKQQGEMTRKILQEVNKLHLAGKQIEADKEMAQMDQEEPALA